MLAASVLLGHGAAVCAGEAAASEGAVGRTNLIRTTGLADAYSVFECSGTTISAKGLYARDRLRKMFIYNYEDESGGYSMRAGKDGSYTAELNMSLKNGSYRLALRFESGALMLYKVYFNEQSGWYFPLNGLERTNREVFGHIFEAPAEASALYLSANNDPGEINTALEQIERYALSITEGLDDDLEKARAISRFISGAFYYDEDARDTDAGLDTIALYNVLKSGRTVCGGFANLFCAMAEAVGLDAVNIKGGVVGGGVTYETLGDGVQNHEWAAFWYEKEQRWIWADPCWDGAGSYKAGEFEAGDPKEMYIDAGDVALSFNHRADKAERRHYFAAKPETSPVGISGGAGETADTGETAATAATGAELLPAAESEAAAVTSAAAPAVRPTVAEKEDNTVLIVMIAVLGALTLVAAVIVAITIKNGRKKLKMVVIELENGKKIKLELYPEIAPISAANFENLVRKGFYDGLTFHRVIPGFMIQGGCPNGNGTGSSGERIKGEFAANGVPNDLKHTRGVLSMARAADPNSASCQFFIMHKDAPHLDGSYAAFGKVVEGIEVVDEIAAVETDYADKPVTPVVMKRVYIEE
ncbi:MAG: peptidylprolyl isomerase [Ruminiclostridium sp.]|nr:peptidylprolyl isomerase [Ruminiclostridium sp.]